LKKVNEILDREGYTIGNIDSVIIAQRPKLLPHIPQMIENISDVLGLDKENISIKATTTEGLGFAGREEGIAAQAVAIISKKDK